MYLKRLSIKETPKENNNDKKNKDQNKDLIYYPLKVYTK